MILDDDGSSVPVSSNNFVNSIWLKGKPRVLTATLTATLTAIRTVAAATATATHAAGNGRGTRIGFRFSRLEG